MNAVEAIKDALGEYAFTTDDVQKIAAGSEALRLVLKHEAELKALLTTRLEGSPSEKQIRYLWVLGWRGEVPKTMGEIGELIHKLQQEKGIAKNDYRRYKRETAGIR